MIIYIERDLSTHTLTYQSFVCQQYNSLQALYFIIFIILKAMASQNVCKPYQQAMEALREYFRLGKDYMISLSDQALSQVAGIVTFAVEREDDVKKKKRFEILSGCISFLDVTKKKTSSLSVKLLVLGLLATLATLAATLYNDFWLAVEKKPIQQWQLWEISGWILLGIIWLFLTLFAVQQFCVIFECGCRWFRSQAPKEQPRNEGVENSKLEQKLVQSKQYIQILEEEVEEEEVGVQVEVEDKRIVNWGCQSADLIKAAIKMAQTLLATNLIIQLSSLTVQYFQALSASYGGSQ